MAEKVSNYTVEQTQKIVVDYLQGVSVETIAENVGKSVRSVVAKLSREGVYKKKEYVTKNGDTVVSKEELSDRIGALCGLSEGEIDSLTKANKTALQKVLQKVSAVV